jgi:hypothetical protein
VSLASCYVPLTLPAANNDAYCALRRVLVPGEMFEVGGIMFRVVMRGIDGCDYVWAQRAVREAGEDGGLAQPLRCLDGHRWGIPIRLYFDSLLLFKGEKPPTLVVEDAHESCTSFSSSVLLTNSSPDTAGSSSSGPSGVSSHTLLTCHLHATCMPPTRTRYLHATYTYSLLTCHHHTTCMSLTPTRY